MSEEIELRCFHINKINDKDDEILEYQDDEKDHSTKHNNDRLKSNFKNRKVDEYDFFTKCDTQIVGKVNKNSKKIKKQKRVKQSNLMDLISTELQSLTTPVTENNIITTVNYSDKQSSSYLVVHPSNIGFHSWSFKSQNLKLNPMFPRVLETDKDLFIPVEYVKPVKFVDLAANKEDGYREPNTKFLDIEINNLKFNHHHAFSLEMLLCMKLLEFYNQYKKIEGLTENISRDIKINRKTRAGLREQLLKIDNKREDIRFDETLRKYMCTMLQLKQEYFKALEERREIVHKIISLWSDIETVREKTDFVHTPYVLQINKILLDKTEYEKEWNETFAEEYIDVLNTIEYEYVSKYLEYKEAKRSYNVSDSAKKVTKPKLQVDEEKLKVDVENIANNIVTQEKTEIILISNKSILTDAAKSIKLIHKYSFSFKIYVDDIFVCESENYSFNNENFFQIEFNESYSIQILPQNKTVLITLCENNETAVLFKKDIKSISFREDLSNQHFLYENIVKPSSKHVGSGHNIKDIIVANKVRLKSTSFFKGDLYTNCEVGIKIVWNNRLSQSTSEAIKSYEVTKRKLKRLMHGIDIPKIESLKDLISEIYNKDIDKDEEIINTLRSLCKGNISVNDKFETDENHPDYTRLKLINLRNNGGFTNVQYKRIPLFTSQISTEHLQCLQRSSENEFNFQYLNEKSSEMSAIELQRLIGATFVQKLNKNMVTNLNEHLLKKTYKDVVRDFQDLSLRGLLNNQLNLGTLATLSSSTKQKLLNESLEKEQEIQITVIRAYNLVDRSDFMLEEDKNDDDDDGRIAGNNGHKSAKCSYHSYKCNVFSRFKVRPLRPFVRVSYKDTPVSTATAIGCHPTWNQTVKIKTVLKPMSSIHINLFDEYKVNISEAYPEEDQSFHSKTVHYRYYNKWLGTVKIPLYTVLALGTVRETFKISTPPILLGYETASQTKESTQSLIPEVVQLMKKETSFVSLQISTSLSHLGRIQGYNQPVPHSSEDHYLIKHLNNFVTEYTHDFPSRNISLTFIDSSGRNKCVTQFLQPIPPPDGTSFPKNPKLRSESAMSKSSGLSKSSSSKSTGRKRDFDLEKGTPTINEERESVHSLYEGNWRSDEPQLVKVINGCLRYVALIPSYEVTEPHTVTLGGLEILQVLYGSPLDHTILLASYFLYLGVKCWVVIGMGIPNGLSSYVLAKYDLATHNIVMSTDKFYRSKGILNKSDGFVWHVYDASNGERYELRDISCPLKTVDYVFDNENIWVNMQSSLDCESMAFDFSRTSDWQPVFDKTVFVLKQPIVTETSLYSTPAEIEDLRNMLETKLKSKIQKWRSHMKTIWNRYCSGLLREMLPLWEYWSFNPSEPKPGPNHKLKQLMVTYRIFGLPLNMPYVNTKSVMSTVKSTAIHATDDPNVEFGLAVEVYTYPNNIVSVWVFLASVTRI